MRYEEASIQSPRVTLLTGDCLAVLPTLPDASVDAIVTDPPYGLRFMGKAWDYDVPRAEVWRACLRVLKPGGHLLAFAGTRTQHRMAVAIEDAGFEIRDLLAWAYGSGFPKSLDVSKAIDKAAGAEREVVGQVTKGSSPLPNNHDGAWTDGQRDGTFAITAPATDAARQWAGWGTALKPALEPITLARKPLDGTVAETVLRHGTGALHVDGCRLREAGREADGAGVLVTGRWPANLLHDGSDEATAPLGAAARFFYSAKASRADRDAGLEGFAVRTAAEMVERAPGSAGAAHARAGAGHGGGRNHHPAVKPTDLMRYLVRLVTPPGGVVLDPFMGSGSTGKAAVLEGARFVGIERDPDYAAIAAARIAWAEAEVARAPAQPGLFDCT